MKKRPATKEESRPIVTAARSASVRGPRQAVSTSVIPRSPLSSSSKVVFVYKPPSVRNVFAGTTTVTGT